ncbi:MAG: DUF4115 domain-containing protein [candidate division Zixibacteria bacterium]|nr:DUF4115 domain-containing protein [candidate division Zixibacteria bacterium]MDD5424860.1 DUF4115 domain-containing protein [candidate division Zixibacteria bacterium]
MNEIYIKFGQALKHERENKNISLADLSEELKISEENLNYLELGEVDKLPSELYYNLFAKSYARALGIDYNRTIEAIKEDLGEAIENNIEKKAEITKEVKPGPTSGEDALTAETNWLKKKFLTLILVVIGIFICFMVVYKLFLEGENTRYSSSEPEKSSPTVKDSSYDTGHLENDLENFQWNKLDYQEPSPLIMTLTARETCWASVLTDGDTVLYRNLVPWREYKVEAKYRIRISLAQPSLVQIKINDVEVDLRDPEKHKISGVEVNQANLASYLNPTLPDGGTDSTGIINQADNQKPADTGASHLNDH